MIQEALDSNWIAPVGPDVNGFERDIADYVGVDNAAAVVSGTAALHLALLYYGVGRGDEVLCPSLTFIGSVNPILYCNATPVFLDSVPATWTLDPDLLESVLAEKARLNRLPKAVIAVDLYGQCADYGRIEAICEEYSVVLIEDAAEALGADCRGRKAGRFGQCAVLSFNGNKIITSSGGGMLVSEDRDLIERTRFLSTQARDGAVHYEHSVVGFNYRMSNIVAALGRGQLMTIEQRVERRREVFDWYHDELAKLPGIHFMPEADYGRANRWLTCIVIEPDEFGATREDIRLKLDEHRIESRPLWKPMHLQPLFKDAEMHRGTVVELLFKEGLCLPSGTAMTRDDVARVGELIKQVHTS